MSLVNWVFWDVGTLGRVDDLPQLTSKNGWTKRLLIHNGDDISLTMLSPICLILLWTTALFWLTPLGVCHAKTDALCLNFDFKWNGIWMTLLRQFFGILGLLIARSFLSM